MATCMYCGATIADGTKFCTSCGAALPVEAPMEVEATVIGDEQGQPYRQPSYGQPTPPQSYQPYGQAQPTQPYASQGSYDSGSIGWGVLGFLFPIVGIILFIVWRNEKPKCAKVSLYGALISIGLSIVFSFIGGCSAFWAFTR